MRNTIGRVKLIKNFFWWMSLPLLGGSAAYAFITHQNPLALTVFQIAMGLCAPYLIVKTDELRNECIEDFSKECEQMTNAELFDFGDQMKFLPVSESKALMRVAYEAEMKRRFGFY